MVRPAMGIVPTSPSASGVPSIGMAIVRRRPVPMENAARRFVVTAISPAAKERGARTSVVTETSPAAKEKSVAMEIRPVRPSAMGTSRAAKASGTAIVPE